MSRMTFNLSEFRTSVSAMLLLLSVLLLGLFSVQLAHAAPSKSATILVALSKSGGIYQDVLDGLVSGLGEQGAIGEFEIVKADLSGADALPKSLMVGKKYDLIISVGVRATEIVLRENNSIPLLSLLVPKLSVQMLDKSLNQNSGTSKKKKTSYIFLDQPPERQLEVLKKVLPGVKSVGVVLGDSDLERLFGLKSAAEKYGVELNIAVIRPEDRTARKISDLAEHSDAMLALYDPILFNGKTARWLLFSAYQFHVPVVGFSSSFVQAGALFSVYSTPRMIGRQAAEIVVSMKKSRRWARSKRWYPKYFTIDLNRRLAHSLDMMSVDVHQIGSKIEGFID